MQPCVVLFAHYSTPDLKTNTLVSLWASLRHCIDSINKINFCNSSVERKNIIILFLQTENWGTNQFSQVSTGFEWPVAGAQDTIFQGAQHYLALSLFKMHVFVTSVAAVGAQCFCKANPASQIKHPQNRNVLVGTTWEQFKWLEKSHLGDRNKGSI